MVTVAVPVGSVPDFRISSSSPTGRRHICRLQTSSSDTTYPTESSLFDWSIKTRDLHREFWIRKKKFLQMMLSAPRHQFAVHVFISSHNHRGLANASVLPIPWLGMTQLLMRYWRKWLDSQALHCGKVTLLSASYCLKVWALPNFTNYDGCHSSNHSPNKK